VLGEHGLGLKRAAVLGAESWNCAEHQAMLILR
jgi:hypothetical protein